MIEQPVFWHELNGASCEVYKNSVIFHDHEKEEIIGELEWKEIYKLAEEYLLT